MHQILIESNKLKKYLDRYNYIPIGSGGFFKPTEEFEEWFGYITRHVFMSAPGRSMFNSSMSFLSLKNKPCEIDLYYKLRISHNYYFVFEFPDEETALYFKIKFDI